MLATVPLNESTQYQVEMFLKPTFAASNGAGVNWSIGGRLDRGSNPSVDELLVYSLGLVVPPEIPNQVDEANMIVWELYRLETELMTQPKTYSTGVQGATNNVGGVEGPQLYFWAVGGAPLDVVGCKPRSGLTYPSGSIGPSTDDEFVSEKNDRRKVDSPQFPVDCWIADPSRNDNCRYFGRVVGGNATPPVVTYGNSSTVPLLDENGVGVLLLNGRLYVTCADMLGLVSEVNEDTLGSGNAHRRIQSSAGRFFRFHFRQRRVKNPYTINLLYKQVFNKPPESFNAQVAVTEVTMTNELQPLPTTLQGTVGTVGNEVTEALRAGTAVLQTAKPLINTQM